MQQQLQSPTWVIRTIITSPVDLGRASREAETGITFRPVAVLCSVLAVGLGWLIGGWVMAAILPLGVWFLFLGYHGVAIALGGRGRWLALAGVMSRMFVVAVPIMVLFQLASVLPFFAISCLKGLGGGIFLAIQIATVFWAIVLTTSLVKGVYELSWGKALLTTLVVQIVFPIVVSLVRPLVLITVLR